MRKIIWAKSAKINLEECLSFWIEHNHSNAFSKKIQKAIYDVENLLQIFPFIGKKTSKKDIRRILVLKRFILFYKVEKDFISILVFKDGKMDGEH